MADAHQYEVLEKIGHGSFGIIRKVRRKNDGLVMCRKEISYVKTSQKEREQIHAEFSILSSLRHPNIVAYYHREHLKDTQELHIYMEYCGNGDLLRVIKDLQAKNEYAEEEFVWSIFSQLVTALYRCHYGSDPPEVGSNILGVNAKPKPLIGKTRPMILHRDLKPENVFLGENNSVKLGDFGLSKVISAHDFASTYVGTPFYMSPEVCAAERYAHYSDVWSLGCIMYELCTKQPPFNAKHHAGLVQKIKDGRVAPLPNIYSAELQDVIRSCLRVNPNQRPDMAQLINLPIVKLMRKEREVVEFSLILKSREETARRKLKDLEERLQREREQMQEEIESRIRREWEVKARLEIDNRIQTETDKLNGIFQSAVDARVQSELAQRPRLGRAQPAGPLKQMENINEEDEPSKPPPARNSAERSSRTPLHRSQTMFEQAVPPSPMDVSMCDASPVSLASLSLSPRRGGQVSSGGTGPSRDGEGTQNNLRRNIFAAAAAERRAQRLRQDVDAPAQRLQFPLSPSPSPDVVDLDDCFNDKAGHIDRNWGRQASLHREGNEENVPPVPSPTRAPGPRPRTRPGLTRAATTGNTAATNVKTASAAIKGRTLVELAQNRVPNFTVPQSRNPAVWDPDTDDMPSPFIVRGRAARDRFA